MSHSNPSPVLYIREGLDYRAATGDELLAAVRRVLSHQVRRGRSLQSPEAVRTYLRIQLASLEHEVFCMLAVDARQRLIALRELFRGTVDGATVHPREVVKEALKLNAAAVLFVHNHPSGEPEPSRADEVITQRLKEALSLVEVRVLDHLIVGADGIVSFAERGLL